METTWFDADLPAALIAASTTRVFAGPATDYGLFNTGVDDQQKALTDNTPDPHYEMIEPSQILGTPIVTTAAGGFPIPPWLDDNHLSAWLTPANDYERSRRLRRRGELRLSHDVRFDGS